MTLNLFTDLLIKSTNRLVDTIELGNISIYRYRDMRLNIVLDFGYRNMA